MTALERCHSKNRSSKGPEEGNTLLALQANPVWSSVMSQCVIHILRLKEVILGWWWKHLHGFLMMEKSQSTVIWKISFSCGSQVLPLYCKKCPFFRHLEAVQLCTVCYFDIIRVQFSNLDMWTSLENWTKKLLLFFFFCPLYYICVILQLNFCSCKTYNGRRS